MAAEVVGLRASNAEPETLFEKGKRNGRRIDQLYGSMERGVNVTCR
jgi:hypothetical protein